MRNQASEIVPNKTSSRDLSRLSAVSPPPANPKNHNTATSGQVTYPWYVDTGRFLGLHSSRRLACVSPVHLAPASSLVTQPPFADRLPSVSSDGHSIVSDSVGSRHRVGPPRLHTLNPPNYVIRSAIPADLPIIYDLQHKVGRDAGYIPRGGIDRNIRQRRITVVECNSEIAGYALVTPRSDGLHHILQHVVHPDLWRRRYATALAAAVWHSAARQNARAVIAKPAEGIAAVDFFESLGMISVGTIPSKRRRCVALAAPLPGHTIDIHDFPASNRVNVIAGRQARLHHVSPPTPTP